MRVVRLALGVEPRWGADRVDPALVTPDLRRRESSAPLSSVGRAFARSYPRSIVRPRRRSPPGQALDFRLCAAGPTKPGWRGPTRS